jgi:hypothetical protein
LLSYTKIVNRYTYIKIIANRYTYVEIKTYLKCSSDEVYKHSKINKMKQGKKKKKRWVEEFHPRPITTGNKVHRQLLRAFVSKSTAGT